MKPLTNRALKWQGKTVPCTVRLTEPVVGFIDAHLHEDRIHNRSEFLQHWAQVGMLVGQNPELADALDWALGKEEPKPEPVSMEPMNAPLVNTMEYDSTPQVYENVNPEPEPETPLQGVYDDILEKLRSRVH